MTFRTAFAAMLVLTLAACQMETGGQGFNPGTGGSGGFNPGSDTRPPFNPGSGSRPPLNGGATNRPSAGLELAKDACLREGERRGMAVHVLAAREMRGGAEVILRVGPGLPPFNTQRVRCFFDYGSGRATISEA